MSSGPLHGELDAGEEITVALGKAGQPPLEGAVSRDRGEGPFERLRYLFTVVQSARRD
jgi:hypothetical protein